MVYFRSNFQVVLVRPLYPIGGPLSRSNYDPCSWKHDADYLSRSPCMTFVQLGSRLNNYKSRPSKSGCEIGSSYLLPSLCRQPRKKLSNYFYIILTDYKLNTSRPSWSCPMTEQNIGIEKSSGESCFFQLVWCSRSISFRIRERQNSPTLIAVCGGMVIFTKKSLSLIFPIL